MFLSFLGCYSPQESPFETVEVVIRTDADGIAELPIRVPENVTSFVATVEANEAVYAQALLDPNQKKVMDSEKWRSQDSNLTNAVWPYFADSTLQWPVRNVDTALFKGKWRIWWHVPEQPKEKIKVSVTTATDTDWSFGNLKVSFCFGSHLKEAPESYEAVQDAIDQFVELYSQQDVTVLEEPCDHTVPNELSLLAPLDKVMDIRQSLPPETMVVIFGNWIDSDPIRLGFSGSIPGPMAVHPRAYIGVSWMAHAGADGAFSEQDIRILSETLAHETGHYLGLFHPVELDFSAYDALDDTPECEDLNTCTSVYKNHLMFAAPVCTLAMCAPQFEVSSDQFDVMHRHTAVY